MNATAELELAPIEATREAPLALDLRKIDLTDVALAQYGDWRKDVAATKANLSTLVLDLSTPTKIKEARTLRHRLIGEPLATVRKVAAGIKSKMATTSKAVGAELEQIEAAYTAADALILPKIEAREAELEAERLEKARIEAERVEALQAGVARLLSYSDRAIGQPAEKIAQAITALEAMTFPEERWQEFAGRAAEARQQTVLKLLVLHSQALEAERLRAENERLMAEAAQRKQEEEARAWDPVHRAVEAVIAAHGPALDERMKALGLPKTVTTPDGTVADAGTGEVLSPAPAFGASEAITPEYVAAQESLNDQARALLAAAAAPVPAASVHVDTSEAPAVKLGDLCTRLGFVMTEAFVRHTLQIQPVPSKGRAVLIAEAALPALREALVARIQEVLG
ncbi:MAG: hypothetical protein ACOVPA_02795 [Rubrivivax sp.]